MTDEQKIRQIARDEILKDQNKNRFSGITAIINHNHDNFNSPAIEARNIVPSVSVSGRITFAQETDYTINLNSSFTPSNIQLYGIATGVTGLITFTTSRAVTVAAGTKYTVSGITFTVFTGVVSSFTLTVIGSTSLPPTSGTLTKVYGSGTGSTPIDYTSYSDGTTVSPRCHIMGSANLGTSFYLQPFNDTSVVTGNIQYPFIDPNINGGTTVPLQSSTYLWVDNGSTTFHGQPGEGHIVDVQWGGTIYARATVTDFSKTSIVIHVSNLETNWEIYANVIIT